MKKVKTQKKPLKKDDPKKRDKKIKHIDELIASLEKLKNDPDPSVLVIACKDNGDASMEGIVSAGFMAGAFITLEDYAKDNPEVGEIIIKRKVGQHLEKLFSGISEQLSKSEPKKKTDSASKKKK